MTVTHFSEGAITFSTPISFLGSQRPRIHSITDKKMGRIRENVFSNSCLPHLMSGIAGSLITKHPLPLLVGLSACFPLVRAQKKIGRQFQVNTYITGNQHLGYSSTSSLSNGNFVVAWYDESGEDGSGYGVFAQIFNATGAKVGNQFQVNTYTSGNQLLPLVSSLSNGDFVITWTDESGEDGSGYGVFAQIFNATGAKVGSQFQVNTYIAGNQWISPVSSLSNGNFVVAWEDDSGLDGNGDGVFGQIFNTTGAKVGNQFQVNTYTAGNQGTPFVSSLSNGDFVVTWEDESGLDGNGDGVFGQIFNTTGAKVGNQFQVNTYTAGNQLNQPVSSLSNGGFVVTWEDDSGEDGSGYGVFGQIFNATGAKVGSQFQVNTYTPGNQWSPRVSSLSNDNFVVAWWDESGLDGNGDGVFGQIFNATGAKIKSQFQVNTYTTGNQQAPLVSSLSNGYFVVAWVDASGLDGSGTGVYGQIFTATAVSPTSTSPTTLPGATGSAMSSAMSSTSGTTQISSSTTTAQSTTSKAPNTGSSVKSSSGGSHTLSWLWPVVGAVGGVTCLGILGYFAYKKRSEDDLFSNDEEMQSTSSSKAKYGALEEVVEEETGYNKTPANVDNGRDNEYARTPSSKAKYGALEEVVEEETGYNKTPANVGNGRDNEYARTPSSKAKYGALEEVVEEETGYNKTPANVGNGRDNEYARTPSVGDGGKNTYAKTPSTLEDEHSYEKTNRSR